MFSKKVDGLQPFQVVRLSGPATFPLLATALGCELSGSPRATSGLLLAIVVRVAGQIPAQMKKPPEGGLVENELGVVRG